MVLKCFLDIHDDAIPEASYALTSVLDIVGIGWTRVADADDADLVYSKTRPLNSCVWIPATSATNWQKLNAHVEIVRDVGLVVHKDNRPPADADEIPGDILLSTFFLLAGTLEKGAEKNKFGVPLARHHPLALKGLLQTPLVNQYADMLATLVTRRTNVNRLPLWPAAESFGLVLTHDVDTPYSRPLRSHYRRRLRQDLRLRRWGRIPRSLAASARNLVSPGYRSPDNPKADANFGFANWTRFSDGLGIRSCLSAAAVDSAHERGVLNDVNYSIDDPHLGPALRQVVSAGHEVGLHASIRSRENVEWMRAEKQRIEQIVGREIKGVRHHYWCISTEHPNETFRKHHEAGFEYDSSLGMNDAEGFRRGIAVPFFPYDETTRAALPLVEIPPTAMDGGIFLQTKSPERPREVLVDHLSSVQEYGGLATLDWHVEQNNPDRLSGAGPVLKEVLTDVLAQRNDVYSATPADIAEWWRTRTSRLRQLR